jgi:glycosyltransferase involved in cell wall biosynthesis
MIIAAIPAYNEEIAIGSVVLRAKKYVDAVLVIDDGSSDATAEIATSAGALVLRHERNLGKGIGIRDAFLKANEMQADILVCLDADGQHNPDEIPRLLDPIGKGDADMVIGSRFLTIRSEIPAYRRAGQEFLNFLTNRVSHSDVTDSQSGFRAFSKKAIQSLPMDEEGIGIESFIQRAAYDKHLTVTEVPITCRYDVEHASKMGSVRHGFSVINTVLRIVEERRPLLVFGVPGVTLFLLGMILGFWVVSVYSSTQELAVGSALIAVLTVTVGTLSVFVGLMLHAISKVLGRIGR